MIENINKIHAAINESLPPSEERKNIVQNILANIKKILRINSSKEDKENIDDETLKIIQKIFWEKYLSKNLKKIHKKYLDVKDMHKKFKIMDRDCQFAQSTLPFLMMNKTFEKIIQEKLSGEILIDLFWNGETGLANIEDIDLKHLMHVDIRIPHRLSSTDKRSYIQSDALSFISLLPDNSVNYFINAIDEAVLGQEYLRYGENHKEINKKRQQIYEWYFIKLTEEIQRTMKKGWILFGTNNDRSQQFGKGLSDKYEEYYQADNPLCARSSNLAKTYIYEKTK
jgi:hypothetical protein